MGPLLSVYWTKRPNEYTRHRTVGSSNYVWTNLHGSHCSEKTCNMQHAPRSKHNNATCGEGPPQRAERNYHPWDFPSVTLLRYLHLQHKSVSVQSRSSSLYKRWPLVSQIPLERADLTHHKTG